MDFIPISLFLEHLAVRDFIFILFFSFAICDFQKLSDLFQPL
jgi:hypothetical protein